MDSSALLLTGWSSLCQRPSCTLLFTAFMKLKLLYTFGDGKSRKNFQGGRDLNEELGMRNEGGGFAEILRLRSQLFWHSLSHIRRFSPLRMTKRGDARRSVDRRFSSYRQPSPRGEGAPKGWIGHWRYEREREGASQVDDLRKHPSAADAVPLPRWGRLRGVTLRRDPSTQFSYFR